MSGPFHIVIWHNVIINIDCTLILDMIIGLILKFLKTLLFTLFALNIFFYQNSLLLSGKQLTQLIVPSVLKLPPFGTLHKTWNLTLLWAIKVALYLACRPVFQSLSYCPTVSLHALYVPPEHPVLTRNTVNTVNATLQKVSFLYSHMTVRKTFPEARTTFSLVARS